MSHRHTSWQSFQRTELFARTELSVSSLQFANFSGANFANLKTCFMIQTSWVPVPARGGDEGGLEYLYRRAKTHSTISRFFIFTPHISISFMLCISPALLKFKLYSTQFAQKNLIGKHQKFVALQVAQKWRRFKVQNLTNKFAPRRPGRPQWPWKCVRNMPDHCVHNFHHSPCAPNSYFSQTPLTTVKSAHSFINIEIRRNYGGLSSRKKMIRIQKYHNFKKNVVKSYLWHWCLIYWWWLWSKTWHQPSRWQFEHSMNMFLHIGSIWEASLTNGYSWIRRSQNLRVAQFCSQLYKLKN